MQTLHTAQQQAGGRLHGNHRSNRSVRVAALQAAHTHQQRQTSSLPFAGKAALTAAAAATALQLLLPAAPAYAALAAPSSSGTGATPAAAWQPVFGDLSLTAAAPSLPAEQEEFASDLLTEEVALPPELMQFMDLIQQGQVKDLKRLQEARRSVGFDRSPDGRVFLYTEDGEPFQVKNDMGVPGLLLLRDAGGFCYYLPRAESEVLQQIDLSDDAVVAQLFANHAWEELVEPLEIVADGPQGPQANSSSDGEMGRLEQLRMTEREFRSVVSLVAGSQELPEEPLEQLDGQEQ